MYLYRDAPSVLIYYLRSLPNLKCWDELSGDYVTS